MRVLDIGGGWGAFTEYGGRLGARVTSLTISQESERYIQGLIAEQGLRGTTINAVARQLVDDGLITTRRGAILVEDRAGLERVACECHDRVEDFFGEVIGEGGLGRSA